MPHFAHFVTTLPMLPPFSYHSQGLLGEQEQHEAHHRHQPLPHVQVVLRLVVEGLAFVMMLVLVLGLMLVVLVIVRRHHRLDAQNRSDCTVRTFFQRNETGFQGRFYFILRDKVT